MNYSWSQSSYISIRKSAYFIVRRNDPGYVPITDFAVLIKQQRKLIPIVNNLIQCYVKGACQADVFRQAVDVTGITLAKLDGTSKGGVAISIARDMGLPIRFVGVGEGIDDIRPFDAQEFTKALFLG